MDSSTDLTCFDLTLSELDKSAFSASCLHGAYSNSMHTISAVFLCSLCAFCLIRKVSAASPKMLCLLRVPLLSCSSTTRVGKNGRLFAIAALSEAFAVRNKLDEFAATLPAQARSRQLSASFSGLVASRPNSAPYWSVWHQVSDNHNGSSFLCSACIASCAKQTP